MAAAPTADPHPHRAVLRTTPRARVSTPPALRRTDMGVDYCGLARAPFWEVKSRDGERLFLSAFGGA